MLEFAAIGGIVGAVLLLAAALFHARKRTIVARSIFLGLLAASVAAIVLGGSLTLTGVIGKQAAIALYLWTSALGASIGAWRGHATERRLRLCPSQRRQASCSAASTNTNPD